MQQQLLGSGHPRLTGRCSEIRKSATQDAPITQSTSSLKCGVGLILGILKGTFLHMGGNCNKASGSGPDQTLLTTQCLVCD